MYYTCTDSVYKSLCFIDIIPSILTTTIIINKRGKGTNIGVCRLQNHVPII